MKIKNKEKIKIKIWIIILILWIFITCIFTKIIEKTFHLMHDWIKTTWIVTDLKSEESDDTTVYKPKVKYTCNWIEQEQRHQSSSSNYNYRAWTTIHIYCDPEYPDNFLIKSNINYLILICPLITLIAIFYGIKTLIEEYKKAKLKRYLKNFWIKSKWIIKNISSQKNPSSIEYYTIIASDWNRDYISDKIYSKIRYLTKVWDEIEILIDPLDSNKYYINIDEIIKKQIDESCVRNFFSIEYNKNNDSEETIGDVIEDTINPNNRHKRIPRAIPRPLSKCVYWTWIVSIILWLILWIVLTIVGINMHKDWDSYSNMVLLIWITITIIALIYLYKNRRKKRYIKNLKTNWIKLNAVISEINRVRWNRQTWFVILAVNWNNIYKSPKIYAYVSNYAKEWDNITILIDKQNSKKYYMDLDDIQPNTWN